MTIPAISIKDLTKTYNPRGKSPKIALDNVSIDIPQGSIFGLLGPNGAGKSTMINIMAGLTNKTSGNVEIQGFDIEKSMRQARLSLGVVPQELVLDTFFTVRQALNIHAGYYGIAKSKRRTDEIIAAMGLEDKADSKARSLSGGMRRRLLIGKALVHSPKVLILDEPTAGVDVGLRTHLWQYIRKLNKLGTTILLTTHYLEEAEELCDEIAIINHGKITAHDSKDNLMKIFGDKKLVIKPLDKLDGNIPESLKNHGWEVTIDGNLSINYKPNDTNIEILLAQIKGEGIKAADISTEEADLEQVFLHLTK